ncbi:hypothetical protein TKK_0001390 [Trichogramma kaykai]|uniref:Ubiquitin-like domain-containing protein n=1 Tax=Trichogramma kaykai TaxID=54128 RepID=A0ABD2WRB4_9HYME
MDLSDSGSSSDDDNLYTSAATALKALNSRSRRKMREDSSDESDADFNPPSPKKKSPDTSQAEKNIVITDDSEEEVEEQPQKAKTTKKCAAAHNSLNTNEKKNLRQTSRSTRNSNRINGVIPKQAAEASAEITDSVDLSSDEDSNEPKEQANNSIVDDSLNITNDSYVLIGSPPASENETKDDYEATIRIVWRSGDVVRFSLFMTETFQKIFKHFATLEKVSEDQVLITRKEKPINPFDTPTSINWSIVDMFEGGILSAELVRNHKNNANKQGPIDDSIKIKIQTFDKKTLQMTLKPDEPFNLLIQKCSEELKIAASKIKLYFDGEQIDSEETPKDLDIDDEACIDLKVAK